MKIITKKELREKLRKFICKFFDDGKTRLKSKFEEVLGPELSEIFGIVALRGEKNLYCSNLTLSQIKFPEEHKIKI